MNRRGLYTVGGCAVQRKRRNRSENEESKAVDLIGKRAGGRGGSDDAKRVWGGGGIKPEKKGKKKKTGECGRCEKTSSKSRKIQ
jgi:hypothetical protein